MISEISAKRSDYSYDRQLKAACSQQRIELNQNHRISHSQYISRCYKPFSISVRALKNFLTISKPILVVSAHDVHVVISLDIKLNFLFNCSFTNKGKEERLRFKNRTSERGKLSLRFIIINIMIKVLMEN